jgi:hypothetical protein
MSCWGGEGGFGQRDAHQGSGCLKTAPSVSRAAATAHERRSKTGSGDPTAIGGNARVQGRKPPARPEEYQKQASRYHICLRRASHPLLRLAKIQNYKDITPRIRAGIGPNTFDSRRKLRSGPSPGDHPGEGGLPGKHPNRRSGRPSDGRLPIRCFPGGSPAKIRPGRPTSGPEAPLRNIEYTQCLTGKRA